MALGTSPPSGSLGFLSPPDFPLPAQPHLEGTSRFQQELLDFPGYPWCPSLLSLHPGIFQLLRHSPNPEEHNRSGWSGIPGGLAFQVLQFQQDHLPTQAKIPKILEVKATPSKILPAPDPAGYRLGSVDLEFQEPGSLGTFQPHQDIEGIRMWPGG